MSNHISIHGKVGKEPELRYSKNGKAVLELSVYETYGKDDNKKTTWHDVVVFGQIAENICAGIQKGDNVIVIGRYEQDEYTKKDGTKGKVKKLIAEEVGGSFRWNVWVKDRTEDTLKQAFIGNGVGRPMPALSDEEPF